MTALAVNGAFLRSHRARGNLKYMKNFAEGRPGLEIVQHTTPGLQNDDGQGAVYDALPKNLMISNGGGGNRNLSSPLQIGEVTASLASQASNPTHETVEENSFSESFMMPNINEDLLRRLRAAGEVLRVSGHLDQEAAVREVVAWLQRCLQTSD